MSEQLPPTPIIQSKAYIQGSERSVASNCTSRTRAPASNPCAPARHQHHSLVSTVVIKHRDKSNLGRKVCFVLHFHDTVHHREELRWELKQRLTPSYRHTFMVCLGCFLIQPRPPSPGTVPPTRGWALPCQSLDNKMPHRLACGPA